MSDSVRLHRRQPTRLPCPWDSPGKNTGVGCHFLLQCVKVKSESGVTQSCPTPSDPVNCSPPGSSIRGIFQARVLEWAAIAFYSPQLKVVDWSECSFASFLWKHLIRPRAESITSQCFQSPNIQFSHYIFGDLTHRLAKITFPSSLLKLPISPQTNQNGLREENSLMEDYTC